MILGVWLAWTCTPRRDQICAGKSWCQLDLLRTITPGGARVGGGVMCAAKSCPWSLCFRICLWQKGWEAAAHGAFSWASALLSPFCPPCLPSSSCSRWHEHPQDQQALAGLWSCLTWEQPRCLQARRQWGEELGLLLGTHNSDCCFSMWFPWLGKINIKEIHLCGSDKWQFHLVTDCLASAIIRHGCNTRFYWILQLFSHCRLWMRAY